MTNTEPRLATPGTPRPPFPDIPFSPTLPVLLRRATERYGDDEFVVVDEQRLTFAEAERASAALARRLLASGAGKGTRIGIILPTGTDWVVAWLAAARIGAFPMLFPATYRPPELRRALRIGDVALLVAGRTLLGRDYETFLEEAVPSLGGHAGGPLRDPAVPYLRAIWLFGGSDRPWATPVPPGDPASDDPASDDPAPDDPASDELPPDDVDDELLRSVESEVSPSDPLLVIFTSGSSADPKAIVHTHGATIRKVQAHLGMGMPASFPGRTFCAMPFFWVGGPQELLGALHSGATVVGQERFDIAGALDLLERERCATIAGWPGLVAQLWSHPTYPSRDLSALQVSTALMVTSSRGDRPNYGMTETFGPHLNREWFDYKVVDPQTGAELPDGEAGEFCVRGFALMAGMYKKEREEVFDADGWYHTGDRGYLEGDRIWFLGRYSETVKAGGANVSPLEVEQVLASFPDVALAFVLGVPDANRGEAVAAVVVPAEGVSLEVDDLRTRLNRELSAYKVPARWLVLGAEEIPYLASGKPDKRSLRTRF
jgi:acyl-CoA synthetase (AMP-forming)/AMP-acid ligase II